jgi:hypothetical protein
MRPAALFLAAAGLAAALTGCAASSMRVYVESTGLTNGGKPMYMMISEAGGKTTVAEQYQAAAARLFATPPDPAMIESQPIFPGSPASLTLDDVADKTIVIYFFFTDPGQNWRVPLQRPLPAEVFITLGQDEVERVKVRRR